MKTAVLVVDMQNDFLEKPELNNQRGLLTDAINRLTGQARLAGWPVLWIIQEFAPDLSDAFLEMRQRGIRITIAGTAGSKITPELDRLPDDPVIVKKRYSAFFGTNLDTVLANLNVQRVVLAGVNTHACIRMTAIDAYQRDYAVVIPRECVASYDHHHHEVSLDYMHGAIAAVISLDGLMAETNRERN